MLATRKVNGKNAYDKGNFFEIFRSHPGNDQ